MLLSEYPFYFILSALFLVSSISLLFICLHFYKQKQGPSVSHKSQYDQSQRYQHFDELSGSLNAVIFEYDADSQELLHVSNTFDEMTGISDQEFRLMSGWRKHVHPGDIDLLENSRKQCIEQGATVQVEYRIYGKHETTIWVRELASPIKDDNGQLLLRGLITVISMEKDEQQTLMENEARFEQAIKGTAAAVWDMDLITGQLYCSPHYQNMTGFSAKEFPEDMTGFVDMLIHPDDRDRVQAEVETYLEGDSSSPFECEHRLLQKGGGYRWIYVKGTVSRDDNNKPYRFTGFVTDITGRKREQVKLEFLASHDVLTGLVNRRQFEQQTKQLLEQAKKNGVSHVLGFIDLDKFKLINDTSGHDAGDAYLKKLGQNLTDNFPDTTVTARLGGDEFAFLLPNASDTNALVQAEKIRQMVEDEVFFWEGNQFKVSTSIGLVTIDKDSHSVSELFKQADKACYRSKDQGRNCINFYRQDQDEIQQHEREMQWLARINNALNSDGFDLYVQRISSLAADEAMQYEILLRMKDEDGSVIEPGRFLPTAERYGIAEKIDRTVIQSVLQMMRDNKDFVEQCEFISVNLSGQSLANKTLPDFVLQAAGDQPELLSRLCFEINVSAIAQNFKTISAFTKTLKEKGVRFIIDDFGNTLSSLYHLKQLPIDFLRVDGMFIREMGNTSVDLTMVKSINEIGHTLGLQTIAEYVESESMLEKIRNVGIDLCQGYSIHTPVALNDVIEEATCQWAREQAMQKNKFNFH